ncbi:hypothetical protein MLD38_017190 [Melastoma candidum]|uniref:Uncharacterized protein n=1 Tax=Melastoma candidum TaxID=119954 RepID=A0ACB9QPU1_9MYRT|nr:hypothetical protein MLD38_017190 [Melastoma candidum]
MVRGGFDSEVSFCLPGSPKFEQRVVPPSAKCDPYGFEFQTCRRFAQDDAIVQENRKAGFNFSGRPMAYADDLFLNGKILPLKLKLPPCKQGSRGMGMPVRSPSPSPRSPLSPGAFFSFRDKYVRKDDMVTDPFMVALENVKSDKKRMELNVDLDFDPFDFESNRSNQCRMFEPRGVEFARKLRLAQLAEELKEMGTEAVGHVPTRRRIRNFLMRSKRSVLGKLRIGGSSGSTVNAAPVHKAKQLAVVKYKPNKILLCLGYGGMSVRYL